MRYNSSGDLNKVTARIYISEDKEDFVASGFFILFSNNKSIFLVTNKHVVENAKSITISLHSFMNESSYAFISDVQNKVIFHPQKNVDLSIIEMKDYELVPEIADLKILQMKFLLESMIITQEEIKTLNYCEDVIMFGSPDGLYDTKNNMSIAYKGITATSAGMKFNDLEQFYINIPSFPGSSGSAVYLCTPQTMSEFSKTKLIGIHAKSHYMRNFKYDKIYMNLGNTIPAYKLIDFKNLI